MVYEVRRIRDEDLLEGHDWAMVQDGDRVTLFVKDKIAGDLEAHAEAWAAFRLLDQSDASSPLRLVRSGG